MRKTAGTYIEQGNSGSGWVVMVVGDRGHGECIPRISTIYGGGVAFRAHVNAGRSNLVFPRSGVGSCCGNH